MQVIYTRPYLKDMSFGSRLAFIRKFRHLSQDLLAESLGITEKNRRRIITRYEKGGRTPKEERIKDMSDILNVNYLALKLYDFSTTSDLIYFLIWLDELYPNFHLNLNDVIRTYARSNIDREKVEKFIKELEKMRLKRKNRLIDYQEYIEWKLKYDIGDE